MQYARNKVCTLFFQSNEFFWLLFTSIVFYDGLLHGFGMNCFYSPGVKQPNNFIDKYFLVSLH